MILTFANIFTAYKVAHVFKKPTSVYVQVKGSPGNWHFANSQSEAQRGSYQFGAAPPFNGGDALMVTASSTNCPSFAIYAIPFLLTVCGELWYMVDNATNTTCVLFFYDGVVMGA